MADYRLYDVTVSTLTPLHIGNGRELLNEYDYVIRDRRTWRINENALLDSLEVNDPAYADKLAETPPGQLLPKGQWDPKSELFRYVIQGTPRSSAAGASVREQIKDAYDRPYLPGSSLKGALRTVLAWTIWGARKLKPDASRLQRRREWAASELERMLFGRLPNHDLLRALHVGDSAPVTSDALMLANVRVRSRGDAQGAPVKLEAIKPYTTFQLTLKVDTVLFREWARRAELPAQGEEWLTNLPGLVREYSAQRIARELAWYRERNAPPSIVGFYQQLAAAKLGTRRSLLQIGWGTGWESKTYGSHLQADRPFMERVIREYRLAIGKRQEGDPFPKSRRVRVAFPRGADGRVSEQQRPPLGWCLIDMKERKR